MPKSKKPAQKSASKAKPAAHKHGKQPEKPKTNIWLYVGLGVLLLILVGGPLLYMQFSQQPEKQAQAALPAEITIADAFDIYEDGGVFFLDVREPDEWNEYHMPNSTLIPLGELASRVDELPRDQQIVVVCRSGNRSQEGRDILLKAGFTRVTSMAGGLFQWRQAGFPVVTGP